MLFSHERNDLRQVFFNTWQKHNKGITLEAMELIIVQVIKLHPEYHHFFEDANSFRFINMFINILLSWHVIQWTATHLQQFFYG